MPHFRDFIAKSMPRANLGLSVCFAKLQKIGFLWDDIVVEKSVGVDPGVLATLGAVEGGNNALDPWTTGFKDIGDDFERYGSPKTTLNLLT